MNICVYAASSDEIAPIYLETSRTLGRLMAKHRHGLIYGGGNTGVMGAVARGVIEGGGTVTGIAPRFFDREGVLYPLCTELIFTETMRERKQLMEEKADAFLMAPGGIGTLDEFFEILTLKSLGRHAKPIGVWNVAGVYDPLLELLDRMWKEGFLHSPCTELLCCSGDPETLLRLLSGEK